MGILWPSRLWVSKANSLKPMLAGRRNRPYRCNMTKSGRKLQQPTENWKIEILKTGKPPSGTIDPFSFFSFRYDRKVQRQEWKEHRNKILVAWKRNHPGTRPAAWWWFDAPRWTKDVGRWSIFSERLPQPRKRIGGTGDPVFQVASVVPRFAFGIPIDWVETKSEDFYGGIGIDPGDPPKFEAQAAYLKKRSLLTKSEQKRLKKADFEPETIKLGNIT